MFGKVLKSSCRSQSTSAKMLPQVNFRPSTTLGELSDGLFTNYKNRMIYPLLLWGGFCCYYFATPYHILINGFMCRTATPDEKYAVRAREKTLKNLEFRQE